MKHSRIKRIVTSMFTCLLSASMALTSFANGWNGGGTGHESQGSTLENISTIHLFHVNTGFRLSLVNKNGITVSTVNDIVRARPWDKAALQMSSAEELSKGWDQYWNTCGIWDEPKENIVYLGGTKVDGRYAQSNGQKIKKDGSIPEGVGLSQIEYRDPDSESGARAVVGHMYPIAELENGLRYQIRALGGNADFLTGKSSAQMMDIVTYKNPITGLDTPVATGLPSILELGVNGEYALTGTGDLMAALMTKPLNEATWQQDQTMIISALVSMVIDERDGLGRKTGNTVHLFEFYDRELQSKLDKYIADYVNQGYNDGEAYAKGLYKVMVEEGIKLSIEGVGWTIPQVVIPGFPVMKNNKWNFNWNTHEIVYGTVGDVADYTAKRFNEEAHRVWAGTPYECPDWNTDWDGYLDWLNRNNVEFGFMWGMFPNAYRLDKPEFTGTAKELQPYTGQTRPNYLYDLIRDREKVGFNVMYFGATPEGGTSTFDELNYSSSSTNGFRPGPSEDKSNEGGLESKNKIVKYYANKLSNEYIYTENHTRENTVSQVTLENEEGYKVDSWFTSSEFRKPSRDNDSYDDCKNSIPNKQTGTSATGMVQLEKEDTLYLRLVKQPEVTKIYESNGATDKVVVDNNPKFENGSLIVTTPDEGYNYVEGVESPENADPDSWQDVPAGNSTTDTRIPVKDTTKEIFIHYQKPDVAATGLVLHENEISKQFSLADVTGHLIEGVRDYTSVSAPSCGYVWYCGGCSGEDDEDCDGHSCGSTMSEVDPGSYAFSIINRPSYNRQFVYKDLQLDPKSWSGAGPGHGGGSKYGTPDMKMILQRSISDKATLYPQMNTGTEGVLQDMGLVSPSYRPAGNRKDGSKEQATRKAWSETFTTNFTFEDVDDPTIEFEHGGHDSASKDQSSSGSLDNMNSTYSQSGNTTIYGLWGKENKGDRALTDTAQQNIWKLSTLNFKGFKNHIKEQTFTFYPYYKMKFISELDGSEQDAYLTAENLSTLLSLQRIDSSIFRTKGSVTLDLTSSQWSTHAKAHNLLDAAGVENKNSLLPAGAIYDLRTAGSGVKASQSWIGYRVFNSYVMDKNALADATNVKTKQEVVDAVNAFKNDTKNVLSNYEVVMVGQEGINPDDNNGEFYRGSEVITGKDGSYRLGQEFIRDSKYDLQTTGSASGNSSDIDVLEELEETYDWVLTSDADGNVVITRNGTELERLQKNQKNLTNAEVKEFDSRTNIVTNFLSAIDRNMGSDRNGRTWYNEGFSIGCLETRLAYRMGFGDGDASLRSTALNIKANGKLENRNDMFNGDEAKNRSYQFFTSARSTLNGCEKDYVGTYDGIKIFIPNMNQLLVSNRFYTSNTTVMDLN